MIYVCPVHGEQAAGLELVPACPARLRWASTGAAAACGRELVAVETDESDGGTDD